MTNVDLLHQVVEQIEAAPHLWDQQAWMDDQAPCGTTFCIAGWACVLSGVVNLKGQLTDLGRDAYVDLGLGDKLGLHRSYDIVAWFDLGQHVLRLTAEEADRLFNPFGFSAVSRLRDDVKALIGVDLGPPSTMDSSQ